MPPIRAAIVQARPVPLHVGRGIASAAASVEAALDSGAKVIAFGETVLGGYPLWVDEAPGAALWDHPGTKALHRLLMEQAVTLPDPRLAPLQALADKGQAVIVIGAHERQRQSLYNTQLIFTSGATQPLIHRKLVPTHGERLVWARGDGSTLQAAETPYGRVGGLICWEHWMPLARAYMHHQGEAVHVAQWPTVRETYLLASRHYAFEGRCFVLAAGTVQAREDLLEGLESLGGHADAAALIKAIPAEQLQMGGSAIIGPDAAVLAGPAGAQEAILTADLHLERIAECLASLDTDGHYARPDVFDLHVDLKAKTGVTKTP